MFITSENITEFNAPARRIVSVVPSQTEFLHSLGLDQEVVGITKFCIHPQEWFRSKTRVGGTKQLKIDQIRQLRPDLIIANKEENQQEQIELLAGEFPLYMSDIYSISDSINAMRVMGQLTGRELEATGIIDEVTSRFENFTPDLVNRRILYLIWREPFMAAGSNTFINNMIEVCGWRNTLAGHRDWEGVDRYPQLTAQQIRESNPEVILLSSEPYPFKNKHISELQELCPNAKVVLVDGELYSWYGSRLKFSTMHFFAVIERIRYLCSILK